MNKHDRDDFRLFCRQATPSQLREIVRRERAAAPGSEYRETCAQIAEAVAEARGIETEE